jgi:hypothetical protein
MKLDKSRMKFAEIPDRLENKIAERHPHEIVARRDDVAQCRCGLEFTGSIGDSLDWMREH